MFAPRGCAKDENNARKEQLSVCRAGDMMSTNNERALFAVKPNSVREIAVEDSPPRETCKIRV